MIQYLTLTCLLCFLIFPLTVSADQTTAATLQSTSTVKQQTTTATNTSKHHDFLRGQRDGAYVVAEVLDLLLLVGLSAQLYQQYQNSQRVCGLKRDGASSGQSLNLRARKQWVRREERVQSMVENYTPSRDKIAYLRTMGFLFAAFKV